MKLYKRKIMLLPSNNLISYLMCFTVKKTPGVCIIFSTPSSLNRKSLVNNFYHKNFNVICKSFWFLKLYIDEKLISAIEINYVNFDCYISYLAVGQDFSLQKQNSALKINACKVLKYFICNTVISSKFLAQHKLKKIA